MNARHESEVWLLIVKPEKHQDPKGVVRHRDDRLQLQEAQISKAKHRASLNP